MRPLLPTAVLLATFLVQGAAYASPPAMMCSEEQTLSEEVAGSDLVVVGELVATRKSIKGTMVSIEADFKVSQTLYAGGATAKTAPILTVLFTCDSAPIPEQQVGYPSVANHCNEAGMPNAMPPQVSVLTLKSMEHKLLPVKRFVWGPCADLAAVKKKSPHVPGVVAQIRALKLPAPTVTAAPTTTATTTATPVPPVNTIAPAVTVAPLGPPVVPPKSSGCTVHVSTRNNSAAGATTGLLLGGLVFAGIARKRRPR